MITTWKHSLLLSLSFLSNLSLFCFCWSLLLDSKVSRLVTHTILLSGTVLRQEVVGLLELRQQELVTCALLLARVLACLSSLLLSCNLLALAVTGLSLKHRLATGLLLPWCGASVLCSCLPLASMLALLVFQPWPLSLPLVAGEVCCLLLLLYLPLLNLLQVVSLAKAVREQREAWGVEGRLEDDLYYRPKMDRCFTLNEYGDKYICFTYF